MLHIRPFYFKEKKLYTIKLNKHITHNELLYRKKANHVLPITDLC